MSAKVRFWSLTAALSLTIGFAVTISAQDRDRQDKPEASPRVERDIMMLDGRGSRLGVMVRDTDGSAASGGATIDRVNPGSPAEKAGAKAGDVIVEFDGERVRSARQLTRLVQETPEGRAVPMAVLRDGTRQALTVTPEASASAFSWDMHIDGDRIRREVERGLDGLRDLPGAPAFRFRMDGDGASGRSRGRLGVSVDSLGDQLADYFGASSGGALITRVEPDSPASKAGLKAGDVITTINGTRVDDADDVASAVSRAEGTELRLGYLRNRQESTATATIEPRASIQRDRSRPARPVRPFRLMRPA
ncbi:MAG: PDZ domain-containing protein [Acidobacteria bacterium]|nr:PDZ domain-containing protein [Acidobacteriota bacterium]